MNRVVVVAVVACSLFVSTQHSMGQSTKPAVATREHRDALIAKAKARMQLDKRKYTPEQLQECENLYQVANKNWKTPEAT